jgi:uridine phosphorylase
MNYPVFYYFATSLFRYFSNSYLCGKIDRSMLPESELIINPDGSVYHLCLKPNQLADTVIVAGDPGRIKEISRYFHNIECEIQNREFVSCTGTYKNKRITTVSTGIGTDNIDIVMHELDALANIDFKTREIRDLKRSLDIIRIGTSGAIQTDISLNSFAVSAYGLSLDNLLHYYKNTTDVTDHEITQAFRNHFPFPSGFAQPFLIKGSEKLIGKFAPACIKGITATAPGFYGPQGRSLRLELAVPDFISRMASFRYNDMRVINFEMETSALYGLGAMLGHEMVTVCAMVANRVNNTYNEDHKTLIERLIRLVLDTITGD